MIRFTKKKLTKSSLDELAERMPVLSEEMQQAYTGAAKYYDLSGIYLGSLGAGDEMRVIDRNEYAEISQNPGYNHNENLYGTSLSNALDEAKENILKDYLPSNIPSFIFGDSGRKGIQAGFAEDGQFYINRHGFFLDNESSIINTFVHEEYHAGTGNFPNDGSEEYDAIMKQINDSSYNNTTREYRIFVARCLIDQVGISESEAYEIAKVYN